MRRAYIFLGCGLAAACLAGFAGCGGGDNTTDAGSDATTSDVVSDSPVSSDASDAGASCDWSKPFGAPVAVSELNVGGDSAQSARLSVDGLTVYFTRVAADGGLGDIYTATRTSTTQPFGIPVALQGPNGASTHEATPTVTADQLTLYFFSTAAASPDIYVSTRGSTSSAFSAGSAVPAITTWLAENGPYVLSDHSALYFSAARDPDGGVSDAGAITVRVFRSPVVNGSVGAPVEIGLQGVAFSPVVAPNELTIYFSSNRQGSVGNSDIWVAQRATKNDSFGTPTNVSSLNVANATQQPNFVTADGCTMYFHSNRADPNVIVVYRADRVP